MLGFDGLKGILHITAHRPVDAKYTDLNRCHTQPGPGHYHCLLAECFFELRCLLTPAVYSKSMDGKWPHVFVLHVGVAAPACGTDHACRPMEHSSV